MYMVYNSYGDKIGYADKKTDAEKIMKTRCKGDCGKIVNMYQSMQPKASKRQFKIEDLRYRKYVSIN